MCNRARYRGEPGAIFGTDGLFGERPRDNRFHPQELRPRSRNHVIREQDGRRAWDVMAWDIAGGRAPWPMTNVRRLHLPQWRRLAEDPVRRCLVPLTEFAEFSPDKHDLHDGKPPLKGEMWFALKHRPVFAVAGLWQETEQGAGFAMVTCDPNELVAPIHPKAMIAILREEDHDAWLRAPYDEIVGLQRPYAAAEMMVRGPVFPTRHGV